MTQSQFLCIGSPKNLYMEVGAAREEHACSDKSPEVLPESGEAPCHEAPAPHNACNPFPVKLKVLPSLMALQSSLGF